MTLWQQHLHVAFTKISPEKHPPSTKWLPQYKLWKMRSTSSSFDTVGKYNAINRILWFYYNSWWSKYFIFSSILRYLLKLLLCKETFYCTYCRSPWVLNYISIEYQLKCLRCLSLWRNKKETKSQLFTHSESINL